MLTFPLAPPLALNLTVPLSGRYDVGVEWNPWDDLTTTPVLALDISDASTMWQENTQTTQVSAYGDPVGYITNKGSGPDLVQSISTSRPVWARHPSSGVRNLLDDSDDVANGWIHGANLTATDNTTYTTLSADADGDSKTRTDASVVSGTTYVYSAKVRANSGGCWVMVYGLTGFPANSASWFNPDTGVWDSVGAGASSATVTSSGGWYIIKINITATGTVAASMYLEIADASGSSAADAGDSFDVEWVSLEVGTTLTDHQTRVAEYDITEAGVDDVFGLLGDGSDDCLVTAGNVDISSASQVTLCHGYYCVDDSITGYVSALADGLSTEGSTSLRAAGSSNITSHMYVNGANSFNSSPITDPYTVVATQLLDAPSTADGSNTLRINGSVGSTAVSGAGTTFANNTFSVLAKSDTSNPADVTLYSLVVSPTLVTGDELTSLEEWTRDRTKTDLF